MEGEEVESGGESGGGDGELSGVEWDGEEFMACGVVEGEAAAVEVGERGGECEGDGLACGVGVEGEEFRDVGGVDALLSRDGELDGVAPRAVVSVAFAFGSDTCGVEGVVFQVVEGLAG